MNKKLWLSKCENIAWQALWKSLLEQGFVTSEMMKKPWYDMSTVENCWFNLAYRWSKGDVLVSRQAVVEQFLHVFGNIEECNIKLLEWGRVTEACREYQVSLN